MRAAIVGAGIMGRLLALALLREGFQVSVFDQGDANDNCSSVAAGLLTPLSELDRADAVICRLGLCAVKNHWPQILQELGGSVYFKQSGTLVLSHPKDKTEGHHFSHIISSKREALSYQCLNQEALTTLEPELIGFQTGYYFPEEAHIDSQSLMQTLEHHLRARGVAWHTHTPVTSIQPRYIITNSKTLSFDITLDCRGLGAKNRFPSLRGLRGELLWLHAPDVHLQRPIRLLHPKYSIYIAPRPNILKTSTHCRPTLPNHLPRIRYTNRLIAVNGLYRHGFLIAPTLADIIVRFIKTNHQEIPDLWENS